VETGLSPVGNEFVLANPTPRGYVKALELKKEGFSRHG